MKNGTEKKGLFNLYIVWLVAAFSLGRIGGYLDTARAEDLLALIAESLFFLIMLLVLRFRGVLKRGLDVARINGLAGFIFTGLAIAYLGETFYYFASASRVNFFVFLLRTLLWYVSWYLVWWWLINKFDYSYKETFLLAGVNGYIVEGIFLGQLPVISPIGIFLYPLVAAAYGIMMTVPHILSGREQFSNQLNEASRVKRYSAALIPLAAFFIPGQVWFYLVGRVL